MALKMESRFKITRRLKVGIILGTIGVALMSAVLLAGNPDQETRGMLLLFIAMTAFALGGESIYEKALISYTRMIFIIGPPLWLILGLVMHYYWEATPIEIAVVVTGAAIIGVPLGYFHPERKALDDRYRQRKKMRKEAAQADHGQKPGEEAIRY